MKTVPGQILLEIKQQTNSFLVKQNSNGSSKVQFSEYINNLCNSHSFKFAGFLDGVVSEKVDRCQQCNRVGHVKDRCFDLYPCEHYGKRNHQSDKCSRKKSIAREIKFRMDCFLGMVESSQEDLKVIPQDLFESVDEPWSDEEYFSPCI